MGKGLSKRDGIPNGNPFDTKSGYSFVIIPLRSGEGDLLSTALEAACPNLFFVICLILRFPWLGRYTPCG